MRPLAIPFLLLSACLPQAELTLPENLGDYQTLLLAVEQDRNEATEGTLHAFDLRADSVVLPTSAGPNLHFTALLYHKTVDELVIPGAAELRSVESGRNISNAAALKLETSFDRGAQGPWIEPGELSPFVSRFRVEHLQLGRFEETYFTIEKVPDCRSMAVRLAIALDDKKALIATNCGRFYFVSADGIEEVADLLQLPNSAAHKATNGSIYLAGYQGHLFVLPPGCFDKLCAVELVGLDSQWGHDRIIDLDGGPLSDDRYELFAVTTSTNGELLRWTSENRAWDEWGRAPSRDTTDQRRVVWLGQEQAIATPCDHAIHRYREGTTFEEIGSDSSYYTAAAKVDGHVVVGGGTDPSSSKTLYSNESGDWIPYLEVDLVEMLFDITPYGEDLLLVGKIAVLSHVRGTEHNTERYIPGDDWSYVHTRAVVVGESVLLGSMMFCPSIASGCSSAPLKIAWLTKP